MIRGRRKYSGKQKSPSASHRAGGKATKDRVQLSCSNYTTLRVNPQIHAENTLNQLAGNLPQSIKGLLYRMYLRMIHLRICGLRVIISARFITIKARPVRTRTGEQSTRGVCLWF